MKDIPEPVFTDEECRVKIMDEMGDLKLDRVVTTAGEDVTEAYQSALAKMKAHKAAIFHASQVQFSKTFYDAMMKEQLAVRLIDVDGTERTVKIGQPKPWYKRLFRRKK